MFFFENDGVNVFKLFFIGYYDFFNDNISHKYITYAVKSITNLELLHMYEKNRNEMEEY